MEHAFDKRCMQKHLHELRDCIHGIVAKASLKRHEFFMSAIKFDPNTPPLGKVKFMKFT